jgi:hypothetical protein
MLQQQISGNTPEKQLPWIEPVLHLPLLLINYNYSRSSPFAKKVKTNGSTTQKNFGTNMHMRISTTREIKK